MNESPSPTARFSDRVENYVRYRPSYPAEVLRTIVERTGISGSSAIADIGSGTGISCELFLKEGFPVIGVEPNAGMREAAERLLAHYPKFRSVAGTAQATTLADHSIDLITAAQAFHWFDTAETRIEFTRILKPGGFIALIWNERKLTGSRFLEDYEALLMEYGTDYQEVRHETIGDSLGHFFIGPFEIHTFTNNQLMDFESLKGRLLSSSYAPAAGHPRHEPMIAELRRLFDRNAVDGKVDLEYVTKLHLGR